MDGIEFPNRNLQEVSTPGVIRTPDGTWKRLGGDALPPVTTIAEVIQSTHENVWKETIQRARADGEPFAEIELGDPSTVSGREFYTGCKEYLSANDFEFEEAKIPASGNTASRLIARIKL